jgi:hypothetical protein
MKNRKPAATDLADIAAKIKKVLSGGGPKSMDELTRADLLDEMSSMPDQLKKAAKEADVIQIALKAKIAIRDELEKRVQAIVTQMNHELKILKAPADEYILCGLNPPASGTKHEVAASKPTGLIATSTPAGNKLQFEGNNPTGTVTYQIWRQEGVGGQWVYHANSQKQSCVDEHVRPGKHYAYKIKARSATTQSPFSNTAVVGEE